MKAKSLFVLLVVLFCAVYVYMFCTLKAHGAEKGKPVVGPYIYRWEKIPGNILYQQDSPELELNIIDWIETERKKGWVPVDVPVAGEKCLFRKYVAPKPTPTETPYGESYK